jgi:peptidoglycan hydrolase-like protein with peptidoglycan-binding domain
MTTRDNAGLDTDSTYGPATRDAVIKWQQRAHLGADGIVGPLTRSSLGLPS